MAQLRHRGDRAGRRLHGARRPGVRLRCGAAGEGARGMRILWFGDLALTGFGTVTRDAGRALLDLGVDVRFISQNDLGPELPELFHSRSLALSFYLFTNEGVTGVREGLDDIILGR